jgi:hypothetical protein
MLLADKKHSPEARGVGSVNRASCDKQPCLYPYIRLRRFMAGIPEAVCWGRGEMYKDSAVAHAQVDLERQGNRRLFRKPAIVRRGHKS